jgi:hypothetical protein
VRKAEKAHGTGRRIEGFCREGARVVIVDDVCTTGASTINAIEAAREAGMTWPPWFALWSAKKPTAVPPSSCRGRRAVPAALYRQRRPRGAHSPAAGFLPKKSRGRETNWPGEAFASSWQKRKRPVRRANRPFFVDPQSMAPGGSFALLEFYRSASLVRRSLRALVAHVAEQLHLTRRFCLRPSGYHSEATS